MFGSRTFPKSSEKLYPDRALSRKALENYIRIWRLGVVKLYPDLALPEAPKLKVNRLQWRPQLYWPVLCERRDLGG